MVAVYDEQVRPISCFNIEFKVEVVVDTEVLHNALAIVPVQLTFDNMTVWCSKNTEDTKMASFGEKVPRKYGKEHGFSGSSQKDQNLPDFSKICQVPTKVITQRTIQTQPCQVITISGDHYIERLLFYLLAVAAATLITGHNSTGIGIRIAKAAISRRAKCAIECYTKCANSGTPKAVYCACPLSSVELEPCNSVNEQLLKEKTLERQINADTNYKDVRTILIRTEQFLNAFIYVFEYSTISADSELWIFAGASSSPQITFTVPDACRDYQFRTLIVLRSTDPSQQLAVFRPKPIPVRFPPFIVPQESIRLDQPKQSSDEQSVHVSISWHNPPGYDDSDIYGYESPITYPIRCMTPEEHLSQPRVELIEGGARMHINLPIDVLQERCRIYMELDCQKFPNLNYCNKEMSPQCTNVADLWGRDDGGLTVVWQPPNTLSSKEGIVSSSPSTSLPPLYYIVNFGQTQVQGTDPFVRRRIIHSKEIKVPGNITKADLMGPLQVDVSYGIQICGIYSPSRMHSPFQIVPVIPFRCSRCHKSHLSNEQSDQKCVDCVKVEQEEDPQSPEGGLEQLEPVECLGRGCASRNVSATHYISSSAASLEVGSGKPGMSSEPSKEQKPSITSVPDKSESIEDITAFNSTSGNYSAQQWHSKIVSTNRAIPLHIATAQTAALSNNSHISTSSKHRNGETTSFSIFAASPELFNPSTSTITSTISTSVNPSSTITTSTVLLTSTSSPSSTTAFTWTETTTEKSLHNSTDAAVHANQPSTTVIGKVEFVKPLSEVDSHQHEPEAVALNSGLSSISSRRLHQKSHSFNNKLVSSNFKQPCKQRSGIVCEYGCLDESRGIFCPLVKDLRAIYDDKSRLLKLYSKEIATLLKRKENAYPIYDKLYLEFGELLTTAQEPIGSVADAYSFTKGINSKEHAMLNLNHASYRTQHEHLFDTTPFEWTVQKELKIGEKIYGISVCALNSSLVPIIQDGSATEDLEHKMKSAIDFHHSSVLSFPQTLLNPIEMSSNANSLLNEKNFQRSLDTHKGIIVFIGPIFFLLGLLAFGLTIFCFNTWRRRRQRRRLRSYAANHHSTGSALGRKSLYLNGGGARALGAGFLPTISQPTTAITSLGQPPQGAFNPINSSGVYSSRRGVNTAGSLIDDRNSSAVNNITQSINNNSQDSGFNGAVQDRFYVQRNVHF
uniref:Fibronectin type-III domain-containing protein n=1 Tax=Ditylenchus dipsaci TaxID=166011 RepID=A0A915ED87_9BILA